MKKLASTLILSFLFTSSLFSQGKIKNFTHDSTIFFQEMEQYLTYSRKADGKYVMDDFSWNWYGGIFSDNQREIVYKTANVMLKNRKRGFPDFSNYLYCISNFVNKKNFTEADFETWNSIVIKLSGEKSKVDFTNYLKSCNDLFEKGFIYNTAANQWKVSSINYIFGYDSLASITFDATNLICYSKGDSSVISNTRGIYYPTTTKWIGEGGKVTWERAGFSADTVWAEIDEYEINVNSPQYIVKDATFYNYNFFKEPMKGVIEEKVLANVTPDKATYPRFKSYSIRLEIKNIAEGVDYVGGFSLHGRKVIGSGTDDKNAAIVFNRKNKPFMRLSAKTFIIRPERIASQDASVSIYLKNDSIYHPGLSFKFFFKKRKLSLIRDNQGIKITPYFDSYHQVDMDFESLEWQIDSPMVAFKNLTGGTKTDALFISSDYFSKNAYLKMMGMSDKHPLYTVNALAEKLDTNYITVDELAGFTLLSYSKLEGFLLSLSYKGFINYNYDRKYFIVKEKLFNWVKASGGNIDYDVIGFYSNIKNANNATLSLINYDLKLRGVNSVNVSDSQEVIIYPANKELVLKKNRDFDFSGLIQAGRFDIMGSNFSFKYDDFKIDMPNVDSLRIYAETNEKDQYGRSMLKKVKTVIEKINGNLIIDKPNNKSGVKPAHEYPILNSFKDSYVFYDRKSILNHAYNKDEFYFHVEPFQIDSLDNFNNEQLAFKGIFFSAGIFPEMKETLTLQPDYSLGFVKETPPNGFDMYGGKGVFNDTIQLSHEGLRGNGKLAYITSTTWSNNFIFYPDSMNAVAQRFVVEESPIEVEFPPVEGEDVKTRWLPKRDIMIHRERSKPIAMYDMKSYMHGQTMIQPDGLSGSGIFEFQKAELEARLIHFKFKEFMSDTADFRLKDVDGINQDDLAFSTTNVNAYVTFEERYGQFKSNGGGSYVTFNPMQYICFMEEFKWYMDNDDIELSAGKAKAQDASGVKLEGAQFISIHPDQDSLSFFALKANYDLKTKIIKAEEVKFINVADAMVYPDSGKVVLRKKAKMETLHNSRVVASYITQNHDIYNANINVFGKKKYAGTGYIDYIDELSKSQTIYLENIGVDTTGQTYATAQVKDTTNFTLSPNYEFYGKVKLYANKKFLTFNGYSRILHDCDLLSKDWFNFETEIDPNDIYIPIDSTTKSTDGKPLFASVLLSPDSLGIYTSFLNKKKKYSHIDIINTQGYLTYDKENEEYRISNKDKLQEMSFAGNYLSLSTKSCKAYGEGIINLGGDLGRVNLTSAGMVQHNQLDDDVIFDLVMITDFFFNSDALKKMAKKMEEASSLDPVKLDRPIYEKGLREVLSKDEADKLIAQANLYGEFKKLPESLKKSIVFNELRLKWNDDSKSYQSFSKLGIGNIDNRQINKYVEGKVELVKKRSGDILTLYIQIDKNTWYFFSYTRGIMQAISSDNDFNTAITETKPDKRKLKKVKGEMPYSYMYSTERKKRDFLRKFDE